jgi:hypothetical protein
MVNACLILPSQISKNEKEAIFASIFVMQKFGVFEPARKQLDADERGCRNLYPAATTKDHTVTWREGFRVNAGETLICDGHGLPL